MNILYKYIFTEESIKNISQYGNIWGYRQEYDFNFKINLFKRVIHFERRSSNSLWGRHGGGWNVKFGFQASSWKNLFLLRGVLFSFGGTMIHFKSR